MTFLLSRHCRFHPQIRKPSQLGRQDPVAPAQHFQPELVHELSVFYQLLHVVHPVTFLDGSHRSRAVQASCRVRQRAGI